MPRPLAVIAAALASMGALSGCVAAVVPLAAGGMIGKKKLERPKRQKQAPAATAAATTAEPKLTLLPSATALPAPTGSVPRAASQPETGWRALVRHVARAMTSGAACADTAVLIDASVAGATSDERDAAVTSLNALRTMGASVTFVAADPEAARAALTGAGMTEADTRVARPADVVALARTGCVVASGGGSRAAYTGLAWFALPPATTTIATIYERRSN